MQAVAFISGHALFAFRDTIPALAEWYVWIPATPVILAVLRRFPLSPRPSATTILVHVAGIVGVAALRGVVYGGVSYLATSSFPSGPISQYVVRIGIGWLPFAALVYGAIAAGALAMQYARRSRNGEIQAAHLGAALARAELGALRNQLHPHFLFNALHSIGALVRAGHRAEAVRALATLGDLLRELLTQGRRDEIRLSDDIAFTRRYVHLEELRFRDRLTVEWRVDALAEEALVPCLLLQPLVENAIRHGISARSAAGRVLITAAVDGSTLRVTVADDGPGFSLGGDVAREGIGLATTRARLAQLPGGAGTLSVGSAPLGGALVRVELPFRHDEGGASLSGTTRGSASLVGASCVEDELLERDVPVTGPAHV